MSFITGVEDSDLAPEKEYTGGGLQPLIPDGLELECVIAGVTFKEADDFNEKIVVVEHMVTEKGQYHEFTVNHKLKVFDDDIKKRDKSRTALLSYDSNAKGGILKAINAGKDVLGNINFLARSLNGTKVISTMNLWEMEVTSKETGEVSTMSGNNIDSFKPLSARKAEDKQIIEKAEDTKKAESLDDFDDAPF